MMSLPDLILDKMNAGIIVVDQYQSIVIWNHWLEKYSGKKKNDVLGQHLANVCLKFSAAAYQQLLYSALNAGQSRFCSGALHHFFIEPYEELKDKHVRQNMQIEPVIVDQECYALIQITDVTNQYSRVKGLHNVIKELESENVQSKRTKQILQYQAWHDSLTGLNNRTLFYDRLFHTICHAERNKLIFALLFLDLDAFKQINDTLGHSAGDEILIAVSDRMKKCIRKTDTLARLGGDEFALLLTQINQREDAAKAAWKLLQSLLPPFEYKGKSIAISVSIGIAVFPADGLTAEALLKAADEAMYAAKSSGKNTYVFFEECPVNAEK